MDKKKLIFCTKEVIWRPSQQKKHQANGWDFGSPSNTLFERRNDVSMLLPQMLSLRCKLKARLKASLNKKSKNLPIISWNNKWFQHEIVSSKWFWVCLRLKRIVRSEISKSHACSRKNDLWEVWNGHHVSLLSSSRWKQIQFVNNIQERYPNDNHYSIKTLESEPPHEVKIIGPIKVTFTMGITHKNVTQFQSLAIVIFHYTANDDDNYHYIHCS